MPPSIPHEVHRGTNRINTLQIGREKHNIINTTAVLGFVFNFAMKSKTNTFDYNKLLEHQNLKSYFRNTKHFLQLQY